ncbi:hypothetical protein [Jannaschia sp. M317]|uniref:hypothetical protein n=1 Tax=Jannaschia sp. M317 TaxID=2867011 RepID=UPI0021A7CB83|nr:hypothetical protein [Jannaschia sp. M317]UWQ17484.1 hypothetical protein K3551_16650 [Jannaschia sp. M317]
MKRFAVISTAAALSLTAPALAYTGVSPTMVDSVENILETNGFANYDMTTLSDEQIVEIYALTQGDAPEAQQIKQVLAGEGTGYALSERRMTLAEADELGLEPIGEASVVKSVQNFLDRQGFEVDASTLTDTQIAEIYFRAFDSDNGDRDEIETILNM